MVLLQPLLLGIGLAGAGTPMARAQSLPEAACPLVVPANQAFFQPRRIQPDQVAAKNARGCLSPDDAVYGADGCPLRMCSPNAGVIPLPQP